MKNDEGAWTAVTPATVMVHRSNKDLMVKCTKSGFSDARANVVSKTKGNMFGNIIFGGGVGAIICCVLLLLGGSFDNCGFILGSAVLDSSL